VLTGSVIRADPIGCSLTYEDILRDTATQGERDFDLSSDADSKSVQGHASDNLTEKSVNFSGTASSKHSETVATESIHSADKSQQLTKDQGLIRNLLQNMNSKKFKMIVFFVCLSFIFAAVIRLLLQSNFIITSSVSILVSIIAAIIAGEYLLRSLTNSNDKSRGGVLTSESFQKNLSQISTRIAATDYTIKHVGISVNDAS